MIYEMRTYQTLPGKREQFLELFMRKTLPEHRRLGMTVIGPFPSLEDPDVFFWMRGFPDRASRDLLKERFYEGSLWKEELEQALLPLLKRYEVVLVDDRESAIAS